MPDSYLATNDNDLNVAEAYKSRLGSSTLKMFAVTSQSAIGEAPSYANLANWTNSQLATSAQPTLGDPTTYSVAGVGDTYAIPVSAWTITNNTGATQTAYGLLIVDTVRNRILYWIKFGTPQAFAVGGSISYDLRFWFDTGRNASP